MLPTPTRRTLSRCADRQSAARAAKPRCADRQSAARAAKPRCADRQSAARAAKPRCADRQSAARAASGFTLIEIMVVVAIIGLLLTLVAPKFYNYLRKSQVTVTQGKMQNLKLPIDSYHNYESKLPDSLEALLEPSDKNMGEPYVASEDELNDAWGNRMQYVKVSSSKYDIISLGADGVEGGEQDDADLHSAKTDITNSKP